MDPLTLIVVTLLGVGTLALIGGAVAALVISRRRSTVSRRSRVAPVVGGVLLLLGVVGVVVGLAWIGTFYLTQGRAPIADLGSWNILIGLALFLPAFPVAVAGLVVTLVGLRR